MQDSHAFGQLARVEAERRGIRQAPEVIVIGDGASWLNTVAGKHLGCHARVIDLYHVDERLGEVAKALYPVDEHRRKRLADRLESPLCEGKVATIIRWMGHQARASGQPRETDPAEHPRRVLWENLTCLERQQARWIIRHIAPKVGRLAPG